MSLKYTRTITDKVHIKGLLSDDCTEITYTDSEKNEKTIEVADLLNAFKNCEIDFSVSLKSEDDLDIIPLED